MENIDFPAAMIGARPPIQIPGPRRTAAAWALAALAATGIMAASATPAHAAPPGPYVLGPADYFWAPAALGLGVYGSLRNRDMQPVDTAALDRTRDLWWMDRWAAGQRSMAANVGSELCVYPLILAPVAAAGLELARGREGWGDAFAEGMAYAEAQILSSGLNLWVRSLRVHPRPLVYDRSAPASDRLEGQASGSFYSGHANAAFLAATYFSYTWSLRHPGDASNTLVWAGTMTAAAGVAALRVAAGKHYLSDVLVGAATGTGFGLLFPWMHRRPKEDGKGLGLELGPMAYPVITWRF
jgi:membrane-associated phospholipid phosphatase